jgi:hypothetical protein
MATVAQPPIRERVGPDPDRNLALELVRATEAAAISCSRYMGFGDKNQVDGAAVDAMRPVLGTVRMNGIVVIGEGEKDEAPMLYNGERVGDGSGPEWDIAVDPVDGTTLTAKSLPDAVSIIGVSPRGTMFSCRSWSCPVTPPMMLILMRRSPTISSGSPRQPTERYLTSRSAYSIERGTQSSSQPSAPRVPGSDSCSTVMSLVRSWPSPRRPESIFWSASAEPPRACWLRARSAASAARCSAGSSRAATANGRRSWMQASTLIAP